MKMTDAPGQLFHLSKVEPRNRVLVLGIGGAGCQGVARMVATWTEGPPAAALNTDSKALSACAVPRVLQIGRSVTQGMGTAGDVMAGKLAAEENLSEIEDLLAQCDIVLLVVGLGGGTGTGAAPVVARLARKLGVLTLCFATLPFVFEGERRRLQAEEGLKTLQRVCDAVVCLPNERLVELAGPQAVLDEAFRISDGIVASGIHALWSLLSKPGVISLDMSDVRQLCERSGGACSYGYAEGQGPARSATVLRNLLESPLLDKGRLLSEAAGLLVCVTGGPDLTLADVQGIMGQISSSARSGVHLFMGAIINPAWRERLALTVLATENWLEDRMESPARATRSGAGDVKAGDTASGAERKPGAGDETQATFPFEAPDKGGHFVNVEPTLHDGANLDIPTYIRKGVKLSFER